MMSAIEYQVRPGNKFKRGIWRPRILSFLGLKIIIAAERISKYKIRKNVSLNLFCSGEPIDKDVFPVKFFNFCRM
jgi:hypothetical protein